MATNWTWRTPVNTTYQMLRLWWAYLLDYLWDYILDSNWERIVTIVPWGDLPMNDWGSRTWVSTSWVWRTAI